MKDPYDILFVFFNNLYINKIITPDIFDYVVDQLNNLVEFDGGKEFAETTSEKSTLQNSILITNESKQPDNTDEVKLP